MVTWAKVGSKRSPAESSSFSVVTTTSGAFILLSLVNTGTGTVASVSGGGCTWTNLVPDQAISSMSALGSVWLGTVTSTGTHTCTLTFSGTAPSTIRPNYDEFTCSAGAASVVLDNFQILSSSSGTATMPTATPAGVTPELYWGYAHDSASSVLGTNGTPPGMFYENDANGNGTNYSLTVTSAVSAVWGDSNHDGGIFVLLTTASAGHTASAGLASGTGTVPSPSALVEPGSGLASGTGSGQPALGQATGSAQGTGTAQAPVILATAIAGLAASTASAAPVLAQGTGSAPGSAVAQSPVVSAQVNAALASGTAVAPAPLAQGTNPAAGTATAQPPVAAIGAPAGLASGTGTAPAGSALAKLTSGLASGAGTALAPTGQGTAAATAVGTALQPVVSTGSVVTHTGTFLLVLPPGWRNQNEGGPLAPVLPGPVTSLTGTVTHTGTFSVVIPRPGTGLSAVILESGPFAPVLPVLRTSVSAAVTHVGGFTVSLPLPRLPLTGRAGRNNATTAMTLPPLQTSISGVVTHVGVLTVSLAAPPPHLSRFEMFGTEARGELAVRLPELAVSISAKVPDPPGIRTVYKAGRWIAARLPRKEST